MMKKEKTLIEIDGIPDFWERVQRAERRSLVLDYDGTLAPFQVDRMRAFPLDGVVDLLVRIRDRSDTYLAMMTGRPMVEIHKLVGDLGIPLSGSHGTEFQYPDGSHRAHLPTHPQQERLIRAEREALELHPGSRIERKIASVALHVRGMDPDEATNVQQELSRVWSADAKEYDLECRRFSGGIELRPRGIDKGTALEALLRDQPPDSLCVYIGDDDTDEDAFRVIRDRGFGIKVGSHGAPTFAQGRLADPFAVREFLKAWTNITTEE